MKRVITLAVLLFALVDKPTNAGQIFFDDFNDGVIDTDIWYTNNQGCWYYTHPGYPIWQDNVNWTEDQGVLTVTGSGDYIPQEMLIDADPGNLTYQFRIKLGDTDDGGLILSSDPFGHPFNDNLMFSLVMDISSGPNEKSVLVRRRIDDQYVVFERLHNGSIQAYTWYDVTVSLVTEGATTTVAYNVSGVGSGSIDVPAITENFRRTIYGRGAWGVNADVYYDYVSISSILSQPPVAYWSFDDDSDPGHDDSGNGHNGTIYGNPSSLDGVCEKALSFDGEHDYVDIPGTTDLHLHSGLTLSAWVRFNSHNDDNVIVGKHVSGIDSGYFIGVQYDKFCFYVDNTGLPGGLDRLRTPQTYIDDQWHHVAGVYDGVSQYLYVDGVLMGEQNQDYSSVNSANVRIGGIYVAGAECWAHFNGFIDEVRVYDRALSESEIQELAEACEPEPVCEGEGWIAFNSNRDGDVDIWAIRANGDFNSLRQVSDLPGGESWAEWSPDSTKIAYSSFLNAQIWVYDWSAGTNTKIYDAHDYEGQDLGSYSVAAPTWSPDGSRILFREDAGSQHQNLHITVINADGTGRMVVPVEPGFVQYPSWSPSGTAFVYDRRNNSGLGNTPDLWIYDFTQTGNITDGNNIRLTEGAADHSTNKYGADWAPSGEVVFTWGHNLAIIDPGQSPNWTGPISDPLDPNVSFLTDDASWPALRYGYPSWSPDLSQIVCYVHYYLGGTDDDLWVMDASGGNRYELIGTSYSEVYPDWGNPDCEPAAVEMEWVTVGDAGNAPDTTGYGSVGYEYRIGKYEVTNSQYCAFLNAVAKTDTYGLYNTYMAGEDEVAGGIDRNGSSGSYSYSVKAGRGNYPVGYISWYDVLRFANWLHNGQPTGGQNDSTTEDGAYDMSLGSSVVRKAGAQVWLPSEDEWYKAAYYKSGGTNAGYWDYPTQSDTCPDNNWPAGDSGNSANYDHFWNPPYFTDVGAYTLSDSAYGTFDQSGNAWEWNEALIGSNRGARGGSFSSPASYLPASFRSYGGPEVEATSIGFRVASILENAPPTADAGDDQTCDTGPSGEAEVVLDCSDSNDPDGDELTYTWYIDGNEVATGVNPTIVLPCGTYTIELIVNDGTEDSEPDYVEVTVLDGTPPTITCPNNVTLECPADTSTTANGSATAADNCDDSPAIVYSDLISGTCPEVIERTWTATDAAGNSDSCVQTITVQDTTPPVFTVVPQDMTVYRDGNGNLAELDAWLASLVEADDACGNVTITDDFTSFPYECGNTGSVTVTWMAMDDCGNPNSTSATFTIEDPTAAVTYDGDLLLSTQGAATINANLIASLLDDNGNVLDIDGEEVTFTLTAVGVGTIVETTFSVNGVANAVIPLEPAIYMVEVTLGCSDFTASAILVVYNPEGGFATGGGWIVPEADGLNTHPDVRANFGFNAKYKQDNPTGHIEFRYSDGYIDLKSYSIEQLVITGGKIVQFKGWASVNGVGDNWFFVKAIDNAEPSRNNDTFEIKVWYAGVSEEEDPSERAGGVLQGGNIVVHAK